MARFLIGNVKGPAGERGPKGDQGEKGNTGIRGSKIFTGNAITGTSTTATVFSGSGVSSEADDLYLNTSTGNMYRCTVAGAPSVAKWIYACNIKGPQGSTPSLSGYLTTNGDSTNNKVTFNSHDAESEEWEDVEVLSSGEKHSSLFEKISLMFKNIRYLHGILGETDISTIEEGTVTDILPKIYNKQKELTKWKFISGFYGTNGCSVEEYKDVANEFRIAATVNVSGSTKAIIDVIIPNSNAAEMLRMAGYYYDETYNGNLAYLYDYDKSEINLYESWSKFSGGGSSISSILTNVYYR